MTEKSVLCNFIKQNPDNYVEILKNEYDVKTRFDGDYAIFNYGKKCKFSSPIVQEARGIIIDITTLTVVCWPFRKFGNYNEGYVDDIDWNTAKVLEKVDGSITKLWYDHKFNKWQFSTNGVVRAENANVEGKEPLTYGDIIKTAVNLKDINYDSLNKNYTYIFELVSPDNKIVVNYPQTMLYHLGTRSNLTGEEFDVDINIVKPKQYLLDSLSNCINAAVNLNKGLSGTDVDGEGFVVVDGNYNRIKVKSPDYIMQHHISTMKIIPKKEALNLVLYERDKLPAIFEACPSVIPNLKYYDYKVSELLYDADRMADLSKRYYAELSYDRRAVANIIKGHRLSGVGFTALDTDLTGSEILLRLPLEKLSLYIPEYEPEDFSKLFKPSEE